MSNFFKNIHPLLRRSKRPEQYDDTNFAVLNALNYELTQAEQETIASKIQSSLESATDTYLDTWGDWFGVYRKDGWDDEYYRARIIRELLLKRGTIPAIIDALVDFLNDNDAIIQIYEPWRNIFYTNKSKLNGEDHMMGYYYRFAIIDISIDRPFPPEIVEIIKAFKPAGVLFYLRLDTSLNKNKTTVESPYVYLDVTNKTELEFLNGLHYDLRGNISLSDQSSQVVESNIFHTNNSMLNGEDVLAGAFNHGRGYIHLASTTLLDYVPKATDAMSDLKTALGEAGADFYNQTKERDGRTASIQVPAKNHIHTLYSNSIDFGDYDYSGNPNLFVDNLVPNTFANADGILLESYNNGLKYTFPVSDKALFSTQTTANLSGLLPQTAYTWSLDFTVDEGYTGDLSTIRIAWRREPTGAVIFEINPAKDLVVGKKVRITTTASTTASIKEFKRFYLTVSTRADSGDSPFSGTFKIENLKLEEGMVATPYQPNLLGAPYYLGTKPVNENLENSGTSFPVNTTDYWVFKGRNREGYKVGDTYTLTMKATKPATQKFGLYLRDGSAPAGELSPVEGLIDTWQLTFTVTQAHIDNGAVNHLNIFQLYNGSGVGAVKIDWLKLEKGDTRTPLIESYDYVGTLVEDTDKQSMNPKLYTWAPKADVTHQKAYMVFDIKTFIEQKYSVEFARLVDELGEDEAYNAMFENFSVSTALKALVSPSSPINYSVELFDFSTNDWHTLTSQSLDLQMKTLNLEANRITDYLNDYRLLFVRYVFENPLNKNVTVELDMLNVLFNYRLGAGYGIGLQSTVDSISEIPLNSITLSSDTVEVGVGESATVTATLQPTDATVTDVEWVIEDPRIATVDASGNIIGISGGKTTLTVYGDDRHVSASCEVLVVVRSTGIAVDKTRIDFSI